MNLSPAQLHALRQRVGSSASVRVVAYPINAEHAARNEALLARYLSHPNTEAPVDMSVPVEAGGGNGVHAFQWGLDGFYPDEHWVML
ncbi:MAG TPA: hypothetical protein VGM37_01415 [Armatimonadota bacterium]